ncbi:MULTISPECIES: DUF4253 domain-containing protein [unclassified Streptomyces]|uniref:DUF4253 domain-containing protein n=1 Tax=unclassified Streptomyces TaxID=2593676 RepID=UPI0037FE5B4B
MSAGAARRARDRRDFHHTPWRRSVVRGLGSLRRVIRRCAPRGRRRSCWIPRTVAAPPTRTAVALASAAEQVAFCPDSVRQGPEEALAAYAAAWVLGRRARSFRWDRPRST